MVDRAIEQDKPNGPVAAALLAGGIGAATLGVVTTLAEASEGFAQALAWVPAVGPDRKALVSVIVFFVAWLVLHFLFVEGSEFQPDLHHFSGAVIHRLRAHSAIF
jgi:hypothetical protein